MGGFNHGQGREVSRTNDLSCSWHLNFDEGPVQNQGSLASSATLLPSAQSIRVYQITQTSPHALTYLLSSGKSSDWNAELSFNLRQLKRICLPGVHRERKQTDRQTDRGYLKNTAQDLWIGVWICARERKRRLPVEWRRGSAVSFLSSWSTDGSLNTSEHQRCSRMPMGTPLHHPLLLHPTPPPSPPFPNFLVYNRGRQMKAAWWGVWCLRGRFCWLWLEEENKHQEQQQSCDTSRCSSGHMWQHVQMLY